MKPAVEVQPRWLEALDELVHPETRGTPVSPLWWTLKSTCELARAATDRGFRVSAELVQTGRSRDRARALGRIRTCDTQIDEPCCEVESRKAR